MCRVPLIAQSWNPGLEEADVRYANYYVYIEAWSEDDDDDNDDDDNDDDDNDDDDDDK